MPAGEHKAPGNARPGQSERLLYALSLAAFVEGTAHVHTRNDDVTVLHIVPSTSGGGAEPVCLHIACHQAPHVRTLLATWLAPGTDAPILPPAVKNVRLVKSAGGFKGLWQLTASIAQVLRQESVTHVVSHLYYTNLCVGLAILLSRARVTWLPVEHAVPDDRSRLMQLPLTFFYRRFGLVAVSEDVAAVWRRTPVGNVVGVLPNPIALPAASAQGQQRDDSTRHFVAVGRLAPQKNYEFLIDVAAHLPPDCTIDIIGQGLPEYRAELHERISRLGLESIVKLCGGLTREALLTSLSNYSAMIMTSDFEGEPTTILEAAALGLPVIGRDTPGLGSCLRKVGGTVVPAETSARDFAQVLIAPIRPNAMPIADWKPLHDVEHASHRYCLALGLHHDFNG